MRNLISLYTLLKEKIMDIPKQHLPIMPYLIIKDAKAFIDFIKEVFDASEQAIIQRDEDKIMHGEIRIKNAVIMFADVTDEFKEKPAGMFIYIEKVDTVYARAVDKGATSLMKPIKMEYGYTAGFEDKFGNQWWIVEAVIS
jgi:uncharacterized glyoxalase superfamily protein PhnB